MTDFLRLPLAFTAAFCLFTPPALAGPIPVPQTRSGTEGETRQKKEPAPAPQEKPPAPPNPEKPSDTPPPDDKAAKKEERVYQTACPALMKGEVQGKIVAPLSDGICGEQSPLSLTAIGKDNPLRFTAPVTTNCAMAATLAEWAGHVRAAALKSFNAEIETVSTGSDYQCRKVNNGSAGRTSEHAFANALDIMSFRLKNGRATELATGWDGDPQEKEFWRAVHKASCGLFMTVIGPDGDAAHKTNLHLDQGCHGSNCTSRICQ
ncbi:hypothetical protein GCM10011491_09890 [Brucella endophytica]|uniref:Extensin-like C-terminal domain-containing protein n=1 Tax=Brucella endophytica TaxID=1963359 RepID=A0A916WBV7_9HYPH|nr:extensin family protein [Brucella endophytica]GGA84407.1 hypothetical protein GCM10011491_09890 [Brucella endophytica]